MDCQVPRSTGVDDNDIQYVCMDDIEDQLRKFPSSFDFEVTDFFGKTFIKKTIDKLQKDESTSKSAAERIKLNNFISYLYLLRGEVGEALEYCEKSLKSDHRNLTANVNKCHFLLKNGNISDANEVLRNIMEIEKDEEFQRRQAEAKADLAYAYARAGPIYHEQAIQLYREVTTEYPQQYDWKFGLGLALVRRTHLLISNKKDILQSKKQRSLEAFQLFHEVAKCTNETDTELCGMAWVQLGVILYRNIYDDNKLSKNDLPELLDFTAQKCFDAALEMCPDDPFVLQKCGQHYRYYPFRDIYKSEALLKKATERHDTCFANHHLALTLMKKVELEQKSFGRSLSYPRACYSPAHGNTSGNIRRKLEFDLPYGMKRLSLEETIGTGRHRRRTASRSPSGTERFSRGRGPRGSMANFIKSPTKVIVCPNHPVLLDALKYLKRAVEISDGSMIMCDLALLYRQLDLPDEALKILSKITNVKENYTSEVNLVGVYEQKGMCYLDLYRKATQIKEKNKYMTNAKAMLYIAIERQAMCVKEEQEKQALKHGWQSYPTLKSLLDNTSGSPSMMMLAKAHNMMEEHEEAIRVLTTLEQQGELGTKEYEELISSYVSINDLQNAMVLLKYLQCTEQFKELDRSLVVNAYIHGALYAMKEQDAPTAVLRFRDAYNTADTLKSKSKTKDKVSKHASENQEWKLLYEIHIVHKCSSEDTCSAHEMLVDALETFTDMTVTINTEDSLGQPGLSGMCKTMRNSENIVIVTHQDSMEDSGGEAEMCYNQALSVSKKSGGNIIVVIPENGSVPDVLDLPNINVVVLPIANSSAQNQEIVGKSIEQKLAILQNFFEELCKVKGS